MRRRGLLVVLVLALATMVAVPVRAQTAPPDPKPQSPSSASTQPLPVDVNKIRTDLDRPHPLNLSGLHFIVEIHPPPISFMALVGNFDLMKGAVPGAGVTGRDITSMMTPREMYSSAGITATDMLQFALTNFAAQKLIERAVSEIRQARNQKEADQIRARIDKELAALMAADKGKQ